MQTFNRKRLVLALSGLLLALIVHAYNGWLNELPFGLHETADDASYLAPARNFVEKGIWKDNTTGASSYVQRPPFMGILHATGFFVFGKNGPVAVMYFAFLLHGAAIFGLTGIFRRFLSEKQSLLITLIYIILPCFWGFLSYQITEAVSSSLVILTLYASFSKRKYSPAITIALLTCCWLIRPVLVLLFPVVIYNLIKNRSLIFNRQLLLNGISAVLCLSAIFFWEKRKADYTGSWGELHPIYHETNQTMFRPVHRDMSALFRLWETKPEDFHTLMGYCWNVQRKHGDQLIADYYSTHQVPLSFDEFERVLLSYSQAEAEIQSQFGKKEITDSLAEKKTSAFIRNAAEKARSNAKLLCYIKTPLKSAKEMLTKSQLNLEMFQDQLRGNILVEIVRYLSLAVIVLSLLFSILAFFTSGRDLILMATGIFLYLFCLFFIQRMCEDRYMIPVMPLMLICGACSLLILFRKKKNFR